jgi:phage terminase large subunit-like protein
MKSGQRFFRVEELTHGNKKKTDRIVWSLQGRFEHGQIALNKGEWNSKFMDELFQFPNALVHDDLVDALAYIDQIANVSYYAEFEQEELDILDPVAGY